MNNIPLENTHELFVKAKNLISSHLDECDKDEFFTICTGYGFEDYEEVEPNNLTEHGLSGSFECFMHIFDYLDETTCQNEEFFEIKSAIEDIFFVDSQHLDANVA